MAEPRVAPMPVRVDRGGSTPSSAVMGTYARQNLVFARGEGSWLYTEAGEPYLDFASGVAVNALGHAHPRLVAALTEQAGRLWHTSNLYRVAGQEALAGLGDDVTPDRLQSAIGRLSPSGGKL